MPGDKLRNIGLYFITDRKLSKKGNIRDVKAAIRGGIKIVQYREKQLPKEAVLEEAKKIRDVCKANNVVFLINDFVDVALEIGADGVHLGLEDTPYQKAREVLGKEKIIGLTVHNKEEALRAEKLGADYIGISPVFSTTTKKDAGKPMGVENLRRIISNVSIPCVAIGGINEENMESVLKAGADGVAMISAIVAKDNVEETVRNILDKVRDIKKEK
jgi:thiamine-phosphate pyrophosphorylase